MTARDALTLVHLAGFLTGMVLYAMLGVMAWRERASGRRASRDGVLLFVSALGLVWNAGALATYGATDLGMRAAPQWLVGVAFSALGFLPAAVIQMAVAPRAGPRRIVAAGYVLSVVASGLHLVAAFSGAAPSPAALWLLSLGFPSILFWLVVAGEARAAGARAVTAAALAAFAMTALHLSHHSVRVEESVFAAVLGHQAALPLVLTILFQDYRFALADLFLKRAVSLMLLVALAAIAYIGLVAPVLAAEPADPLRTPLVVLALWVATALTFPWLRSRVSRFVDRTVLRRPDYPQMRVAIAAKLRAADHAEAVVTVLCDELRSALAADHAVWSADAKLPPPGDAVVRVAPDGRASALVRLPLAEAPGFVLELGDLRGGRRLLSDDVTLVEWLAIAAARRIDEIRIIQERLTQSVRDVELTRLAAQAELRALRAQLNPHFLFNALTTIGQLLRESPERALATLYHLTGLLRAVLRSPNAELVPLAEELEIIDTYLAIEQARFEDRLRVQRDVPDALRTALVPPLLLQPLVENAIKHGIGPKRDGGTVRVSARHATFGGRPALQLEVSDNGVGGNGAAMLARDGEHFGLSSIQQRLARQYGHAASLAIAARAGLGTLVTIHVPLQPCPTAPQAEEREAMELRTP